MANKKQKTSPLDLQARIVPDSPVPKVKLGQVEVERIMQDVYGRAGNNIAELLKGILRELVTIRVMEEIK